MFSLFARILRKISQFHKAVFIVTALISVLCIYPVKNLRYELQLQDMFENKTSRLELTQTLNEESLLSVILEGSDSLQVRQTAQNLVKKLESRAEVKFASSEIDVDFYERNKILFLPSSELNELHERIISAKDAQIEKQNPLLVNLEDNPEESFDLNDIKGKYKDVKVKDIFQNENGTVRVICIFSTKRITSLKDARAFISMVKKDVQETLPKNIQVEYSGQIQHIVQTGKELLPMAKRAGVEMAILFFIILLIAFYRQPQLIIPAGIPIALSTYWTLGLSSLIYGRICLFSLLIVFLLPGLAAQHVTHIFERYSEERRKGLNPVLSLESALLGVGPVAVVSATTVAVIFISLYFVPLKGAHELATLGAIGAFLNWILCATFTPALLRAIQRKKTFSLFGKIKRERLEKPKTIPFKWRKTSIFILIILSFSIAYFEGVFPKFNYNFSDFELTANSKADSLLSTTGLNLNDPAIVQFPNRDALDKFLDRFAEEKRFGKYASIKRIYTLNNLVPSNQHYKLQVIESIKQELDNVPYFNLNATDSIKLNELKTLLQVTPITEESLPVSSKKFLKLQKENRFLAIILPAKSAENGLDCRHISKDVKRLLDGYDYPTVGRALVRADILDCVLGNLGKSVLFGVIALFLLLIMYYEKLSYASFALIPSAVAFLWICIALNVFGIELNFYSSIALLILIGMSVDGSIHFWNHYLSTPVGNASLIMHRYGKNILLSQITTLVGMSSLMLSNHLGLKSLGVVAFAGIILITLSDFLIFPISAATLDAYRLRKAKDLK